MESAVDGDDILLLVTPLKLQMWPAMLVLETGFLYNMPGYVTHDEDVLIATADLAILLSALREPAQSMMQIFGHRVHILPASSREKWLSIPVVRVPWLKSGRCWIKTDLR